MSNTPTERYLDSFKINKFQSKSDFDAAMAQQLIGDDELSIIVGEHSSAITIKSFLCNNMTTGFDFGDGNGVIKFNKSERDYYIILLTDSQNNVFTINTVASESTTDNYVLIINTTSNDYSVAINSYKWFNDAFVSAVLPPNGINIKKETATEISFLCSGYVSDSQMYPSSSAYVSACQTADINPRYLVSVTATEGMEYVGSYPS